MPNSFSSTGLTVATQQELLTQYTAAFKAIYGANINLASDTPDGQRINIFIQSVLDTEDLLVQINSSFDPDNAIGTILDQRVAINGIERQGATFTTVDVTLVITNTVNLYGLDQAVQPVYTAADTAGNQWELVNSQLGVVPGTYTYLFQAANPGQVLTTPGTITVPVTIVLGVTSLTNAGSYVTLGVNEESDAALKVRRRQSVSLRSQGYLQGLLAALNNINGVNAFVHENDGGSTDTSGTPGHSIWVIVSGAPNIALSTAYNALTVYAYGQIASSGSTNYISIANNNVGNAVTNTSFWAVYNPIAEAIYNYRNAGCGMKYNANDSGANAYSITQIDGSSFSVYWYNVVTQNLFIKASVASLNGVSPPNMIAIINYLAGTSTTAPAFAPALDQEVNINNLSTLIQQADPNTLATYPATYGFSTSAGGTYTYTLTPTNLNNEFSVVAANIILLPIIASCPGGIQVLTLQSDGSYKATNTTVSIAHGGHNLQFTALGGYTFTSWAVSGVGGTISPLGLYSSPVSATGTDNVVYTDSLGNTATCTITVT